MEWTLPPAAFAPPAHRHPRHVEVYEVLEGSFEVVVDGHWRKLGLGDVAHVPVNTDHTFRTMPGQTVRVRNFHGPGGPLRRVHREAIPLRHLHRFKGLKRPSSATVMAMARREHADLLVPSSRPLRWAMAALARLGSLVGYRTG